MGQRTKNHLAKDVSGCHHAMNKTIARLMLAVLFAAACCAGAATEEGFVSIFNGRDLTGWDGKPGWWRVEDGALTDYPGNYSDYQAAKAGIA